MGIDEAIETLKKMLKWEKECLHYDVSQSEIQAIETIINEYSNLKQIEEAHRIENGKLREKIKRLEEIDKHIPRIDWR